MDELISADAQECITLDYKRSEALSKSDDKKKLEISKDVSAFANSEGGLIIYGIAEKDNHPHKVDDGSDPNVITREWLEQVINSTILPRIHGVTIKPILLRNGNLAFAVDIPKVDAGGPHQAGDQRYYRRFNFMSVPMTHSEVMDVANRGALPVIEAAWTVRKTGAGSDRLEALTHLHLHNRSREPALYGSCTIYLDEELRADLQLLGRQAWAHERNIPLEIDGKAHSCLRLHRTFAVPADQPFYRESPVSLGSATLHLANYTHYAVAWHFTCPGYSRVQKGFLVANFNTAKATFNWLKPED